MQSLLKRNLLPLEHSVAKIKRFFAIGILVSCNNQNADSSSSGSSANDSNKYVKISLICPILKSRIRLPARGLECKHVQCFDLEGYLIINSERGTWRCPECNKPVLTESLEIDQYYWAILNTLNKSDIEEVAIDSVANWRAFHDNIQGNADDNTFGIANAASDPTYNANAGYVPTPSIKQETFSEDFTKVMSPGSTQLPTWDNTQAMSPFNSHDMNSIANGNMIADGCIKNSNQLSNAG